MTKTAHCVLFFPLAKSRVALAWTTCTLFPRSKTFSPKLNIVQQSGYSEHTPNSTPNGQGTSECDVIKMASPSETVTVLVIVTSDCTFIKKMTSIYMYRFHLCDPIKLCRYK